jgi:hypothetical protein
MTRNLEPGLEPQAHVRVRMYRYSGATAAISKAVVYNTGSVLIAQLFVCVSKRFLDQY